MSLKHETDKMQLIEQTNKRIIHSFKNPESLDSLHQEFFEDYMKLRLKYVLSKGWLTNIDTDYDVYDDDSNTMNFLLEKDNEIQLGFRATKLDNLSNSLTIKMLSNFKKEINLSKIEEGDGNIWDITRLVPSEKFFNSEIHIDKREMLELPVNIIELFKALSLVDNRENENNLWFFVTIPSIEKILKRSGIRAEVLFKDLISKKDDEKSILCLINDDFGITVDETNKPLGNNSSLNSSNLCQTCFESFL